MRRQATIAEIVVAAWELSRAHGLAGFSMRQLGAHVGMRAQSLYSYFSSKHEVYDAMFADGSRAFLASAREGIDAGDDLGGLAHRFFRFCVGDPVRYQLLFQRPVLDFVPSEQSFAIASEAYEIGLAPLREAGMTDDDLDLVTAVLSGLVSQQLANDPGGRRWERLVDRATSMLLRDLDVHIPTR